MQRTTSRSLPRLAALVVLASCTQAKNDATSRKLAVPLYDDGCDGAAVSNECVHHAVTPSCSDGWCKIPHGCFVMGSPVCEWGHAPLAEMESATTVTHDFVIAETEVTQAQWLALGLANPSRTEDGPRLDGADRAAPVGNVTWFEALEFANRLSRQSGLHECYVLDGCAGDVGSGMRCATASTTAPSVYECAGFRLPTEAEWEYAARAGTRWGTYAGDLSVHPDVSECSRDAVLDSVAWYCSNARATTHPVKAFPPNAWGLYDIAGNAAELTSDVLDFAGYGAAQRSDPGGALRMGLEIAVRGGSAHTQPIAERSAYRLGIAPDGHAPGIGFRLARTVLSP